MGVTLGIDRLDGNLKRGHTIRLWQQYEQRRDDDALNVLLAYNKQDTVNLYPLAEKLMGFVGEQPNLLDDWRQRS